MSVNNTVPSHYFSGQGVVMLASRDANGNPQKLRPVGNVSALKITAATTTVEHKEAQTGGRGIDLRLQTATNAGLAMTMESFNSANLAQALRGTATQVAASSVVGEATFAYVGGVSAVKHISINSPVVKQGATTLTAYVDSATPYDYRPYNDGGSFAWNDGSILAYAGLGLAASAIAVGATTTITVTSSAGAIVGGLIICRGYAGADAGTINNKTFVITAVADATHITFNAVTTALTITVGTNKNVWDAQPITVDYAWATQAKVDALTVGITDIWMRFEGLNTAESLEPVVVEVFRFSTDPLKELALISDTVGQFELDGSILLDAQQLAATGSPYFRVTSLDL